MKKIVLTGGGTAGHVTPNIALLPSLKEAGYEVFYIGSYTGIEKTLIEDLGIPYYGISSGKLRRYRSLKNLSDPFRVLHGLFQAKRLMKKIKPDIVLKGIYLAVMKKEVYVGKEILYCVTLTYMVTLLGYTMLPNIHME